MSQISTTHSIVAFDSKTSKAFDGQRLSKVWYKGKKAEEKKPVCVSIPRVLSIMVDTEVLEQLKPQVIAMIEGAQDKIVRERYETGATSIADSDISIQACIAWLQEEAVGGRLTKEYIVQWFSESLEEPLLVAIADKLGVGDTPSELEAKKLEQAVNVFRDSFAQLAGGATRFAPEKARKMLKVLELVQDDTLAAKFQVRLEKMLTREEETEEMLGL